MCPAPMVGDGLALNSIGEGVEFILDA